MRPTPFRPILFVAVAALALAPAPVAQTTWYVDQDALAGAADGSSWDDAFLDLTTALGTALPGDTVHVAGGVYVPGALRTDSFVLLTGLRVLGGYAGVGWPDPDARDFVAHETVLSGDLLGDDLPGFVNRADNAYHVVTVPLATGSPVELDGLTVRGGQADGADALGLMDGGGVHAEPQAWIVLRDSRLEACFAGGRGGGLFAEAGVVEARRCVFVGNRVACEPPLTTPGYVAGGGLFTIDTANTLFGCAFVDNSAEMGAEPDTFLGAAGAGLELATSANVTHCSFVGNTVFALDTKEVRGGGFGMYTPSGLGVVSECLFQDNVLDAPGYAYGNAGGGAWINGNNRITACRFVGNLALQGYGGGLAAVCQTAATALAVENCAFSGNEALSGGGALYVPLPVSMNAAQVVGCTVTENQATTSPAGVLTLGPVDLTGCILWGNGAPSAADQLGVLLFGTQTVAWCDVQAWTGGGTGNIALDPLFVDALGPDLLAGTLDDDLTLLPGSPCIDAGSNGALLPDWADVDGDGDLVETTPVERGGLLRRFDDPATPDTGSGTAPVVDMGAHEFGAGLPVERWTDLGDALAGTHGPPQLLGSGTLCAFTTYALALTGGLESTTGVLVLGVLPIQAPFKGGTLVPSPDILIFGLPTGPVGELTLTLPWLDEEYPGVSLWWQIWISDPAGPRGWAATNALTSTTPTP